MSLYGNLNKVVTSYYLLISIITGLRRGEQLQLTWSDISWLHKRGESYIEAFDFKKLGKIDTGDERTRRNTFTDEEIIDIKTELEKYIKEAKEDLSLYGNLNKVVTSYYLLISIITGMLS